MNEIHGGEEEEGGGVENTKTLISHWMLIKLLFYQSPVGIVYGQDYNGI